MSKPYEDYQKLVGKRRFTEAARLAGMHYLEGNSNNPFWLTRQAAALSMAGKYSQALKAAKQALLLESTNPYSLLCVADALVGCKQSEEARQYYEEILGHPKLSGAAQKGIMRCLSQEKAWDKILQFIAQKEIPLEIGFEWKVEALAALNRNDEAIEQCRLWLTKHPNDPRGLWTLSELEIKRDGLEAVLSRMARAAKIPSRPPIYREIFASLCRRAGKPELALKQYEALSRSGVDAKIQRKQAFTLAKSGKEPEAIPMLEELLKLSPSDLFLNSSYTGACKRIRELERALSFYEQLLEMYPEEAKLFGWIRKIKKWMGDKS